MKINLYFSEICDGIAYEKNVIIGIMKLHDIPEIIVYKAIKEQNNDYFFCKKFQEIGEKNGTCGKSCDGYKPRNKKSGCCEFVGALYYPGQKYNLEITGKLTIAE